MSDKKRADALVAGDKIYIKDRWDDVRLKVVVSVHGVYENHFMVLTEDGVKVFDPGYLVEMEGVAERLALRIHDALSDPRQMDAPLIGQLGAILYGADDPDVVACSKR